MAIEMQETFRIDSSVDRVWQFLMSAEDLAVCLPGAKLAEAISDTKFEGAIKLKIGAITAKYAGTITYTDADESAHHLVMLIEAKEKGGGTINGTITTDLTVISDGETEVHCAASADLTGKIVQVGRGMIEGVGQQIINKFVKNIKNSLEVEEEPVAAETVTEAGSDAPPPPPPPPKAQVVDEDDSINVLGVVFKAMMDMIVNFFKRLFGKG